MEKELRAQQLLEVKTMAQMQYLCCHIKERCLLIVVHAVRNVTKYNSSSNLDFQRPVQKCVLKSFSEKKSVLTLTQVLQMFT